MGSNLQSQLNHHNLHLYRKTVESTQVYTQVEVCIDFLFAKHADQYMKL